MLGRLLQEVWKLRCTLGQMWPQMHKLTICAFADCLLAMQMISMVIVHKTRVASKWYANLDSLPKAAGDVEPNLDPLTVDYKIERVLVVVVDMAVLQRMRNMSTMSASSQGTADSVRG